MTSPRVCASFSPGFRRRSDSVGHLRRQFRGSFVRRDGPEVPRRRSVDSLTSTRKEHPMSTFRQIRRMLAVLVTGGAIAGGMIAAAGPAQAEITPFKLSDRKSVV